MKTLIKSPFRAAALALVCVTTSTLASTYPTDGLVGFWSGDGTAADSSTYANHGAYNGSYAPGGPDGGLAFNLATGNVIIPDIAAYDFQSYDGWSVGFWFNANGFNLQNALFLGQDNGPGYRPKWFVDYGYTVFGPNESFVLHVNDFNQERIFVLSDPQEQQDLQGWHQLTITIDNLNSGAVEFYLDGDSIGSSGLGNYVLQPTAPLIFGFAEGFVYSGLMSDVFLYNDVLTPQEVAGIANPVPEVSTYGIAAFGAMFGFAMRARRKTGRA